MRRGIIFSILLLIAGFTYPAHAEKRVALVVGNSAYRNVTPLDNPANDASLMSETLMGLGFSLIGNSAQLDLDKNALDNAVQSFGREMQGADVALFYYAGHGVQVRGSNYLVPVNANPTREADVDFQMVDINLVLNQMQGSGTRLNLVILDACRNNPFGGRGLRASGGGLAQIRAPEGTLISYATQPGNVAQDGNDGHSPYTQALAATVKRAGLDIFQTFNEVGLAVKRSTGGSQQPWLSSSPIDGSFYFKSAPAAVSSIPPQAPQPDAPKIEPPRQEARLTPTQPIPASPLPMDQSEIARLLQAQLKRVGCNPGTTDGNWDDSSKKAMELFNKSTQTKFDIKLASLNALDAVRSKTDRVCPLVCENGQRAEGDRCVQIGCGSGMFLNSRGACEERPVPPPKARTATHNEPAAPRRRSIPSGGGKCFALNGKNYCE